MGGIEIELLSDGWEIEDLREIIFLMAPGTGLSSVVIVEEY
jgi:hypothetical protein